MASRLTNITASNYACETALSKQSDSTTGIPDVSGSTGAATSAPYVVNTGSDAYSVAPGIFKALGGIDAPWGGQILVTGPNPLTLTLNTPVSLLPFFLPGFDYSCSVTADPTDPSNVAYTISSTGAVDNVGGNAVFGFGSSVIAGVAGQTGVGIVPTAGVTYITIQPNAAGSDLLIGYYGTAGAPVPATMNVNISVIVHATSVFTTQLS